MFSFVWFLFCYALLDALSSFAIISLGKRESVVLLLLLSWCYVAVIVLCLFLIMPYVSKSAVWHSLIILCVNADDHYLNNPHSDNTTEMIY